MSLAASSCNEIRFHFFSAVGWCRVFSRIGKVCAAAFIDILPCWYVWGFLISERGLQDDAALVGDLGLATCQVGIVKVGADSLDFAGTFFHVVQ